MVVESGAELFLIGGGHLGGGIRVGGGGLDEGS